MSTTALPVPATATPPVPSEDDIVKQYGGTVSPPTDEETNAVRSAGGTVNEVTGQILNDPDANASALQKLQNLPDARLLMQSPGGTPIYQYSSDYAPPEGDAASRFGKGAWDYSVGGFLHLLKGVGSLLSQQWTKPGLPPDPNSAAGQMLGEMIQSHENQYQKAKQALQNGNYVEAFGHSLATALPLIGPAAAHIGETWGGTDPVYDKYGNVVIPGQSPDLPQALGQLFGMGLSSYAPRAVPPMMRWGGRNIGFESILPQVQQDALNFLGREGVTVPAGVQTGSKLLRATEATTAQMPYGSQAAGDFLTQQSKNMADLAGRLGQRIYDTPTTPYEVAEEVGQALDKEIANLKQQGEDPSYERAWKDANDPNAAKRVQVGTRTVPASGLLDASGKPLSATEVPVYKNIAQPVDISWLKPIAATELPKLELQPAATQAQSAAASIFKKVLQLDDVVPAQYAEEMLKGFKEEAGYDVDPNARNYVQGMAGSFIPKLENSIEGAIGPEAAEALRNGRRAHAQKQEIIALRKGMLDEPVQEFKRMVQSEDGGAKRLGQILTHAPDLGPKLGRAWFDTAIDLASREGDWRNQGTIFNKYYKLGDRTKAMLFPQEGLRQGLDRFFLGQKITGYPINPSQTALVAATQAVMKNPLEFSYGWLHGYLGSKILFTPAGIKLLVKASEHPPTTPAEVASLRAEAARIAGEPPEEPPEGPPAGGAAPGPGGGGGTSPVTISLSDTLQNHADDAISRMRKRGTFSGTQSNAGVPVEDMKDMAIWGASKFAQGVVKFKDWSKEMLDDIPAAHQDRFRSVLPVIYRDAQEQYGRFIKATANNLPNTQQLIQKFNDGKAGAEWYDKTRAELHRIFGPEDGDMMVKFLAATSPNTTVPSNVTLALKAFKQYKLGQEFAGENPKDPGYLPVVKDMLNAIRNGEDLDQVGGLKVQSFRKNLMGEADPVTIDRWMKRIFNFTSKGSITDPQYKFMDYQVTRIAKQLNMEPRQVQAAMWKAIRESSGETSSGAPFEELINKRLAKDKVLQALAAQSRGGPKP